MPFAPSALTTVISSFALATGLTLGILYVSGRLGWLARSSSNRLHVAPTPVWGGVAIFTAFVSVAGLRGLLSHDLSAPLVCVFGIFALGLVDDIWKLRPRWKLFGEIICALAPILFVNRHPLTGNRPLDLLLASVWVVGITNAFNLLDNINGLSGGTAVLVSGLQAAFFVHHGQTSLALECMVFGAAILGFLVFNFPAGRIFMGDSGSLFIGFWLASATLTGTQFSSSDGLGTLLFPLLVMVIPICDTTLVTLTRISRGYPVSVGGTDHLSHRLVAYGFTRNWAVLALWAFTLCSGALGYFAVSNRLPPFLSVITFVIVGVALFGTYLARFELRVHAGETRTAVAPPKVAAWVRIGARVLFDLLLFVTAYYTAYLIRFDGDTSLPDMYLLTSTIVEIALIKLGVFVAFGAYRPWWDYFGLRDAYRLVASSALASLTTVAYLSVVYRFYGFSRIIIALDFLIFTMLALIFRFSFRLLDEIAPANHRTNVFIYGANSEGETALQFVTKHFRYRVVGFLDDDSGKRHFSIHSVPIRGGTQDLERLCKQWNARALLIAPSTTEEAKYRFSRLCHALGIKLLCLHLAVEELAVSDEPSPSEASLVGELPRTQAPRVPMESLSKAGSD